MTDPAPDVLARAVDELQAAVKGLEARVRTLEGHPVPADSGPFPGTPEPAQVLAGVPASPRDLSLGKVWYLAGRSVLVLAGAFLLRFMTDSGTVAPLPGVMIAVVYSLVLVWLIDRAAGRGDRSSAVAHGLTLAAIAYPLILETTATRVILSPPLGAGNLALVTAAGLLAAWRRSLRFLAWVFTLAAVLTAVALIRATGADILFAWLLLGLGAVTCLLAYTRHWHLKRWAVASILNLIVLRLVILAGGAPEHAPPGLDPRAVQALALALLGVYLGIFTWRALAQGRGVKVFDVCQSAAVLAVGFGGAVRIAKVSGDGAILGWIALAASLAGYTVAFTVVRQRHGRGRGFFYFAFLALIFLFLGSRVVAHGPWLIWCWTVLGLAAAGLGAGFDRVTLRYHAAIYLFLASLQSGLLKSVLTAFLAPADSVWSKLGASGILAFAAALTGYLILVVNRSSRTLTVWRRIPRLILAALFLCGVGHWVVVLLVTLVSGPPPLADAALTALVRTLVVALTATALALAARRWDLRELGWLVYPVLLFGCAKLLLEDLQAGSAFSLFLAFGAIGGALILAPRLLRAKAGDPAG